MAKIDETKIQNWMIEENIFKQKVTDEQANFHYTIEFPPENMMDIIQPSGKDDMLIIICGTQVSPEHVEMIKDATIPDREEFVFDLRFELNNLGPEFHLDITDEYLLQQFVLQDVIYEDGLTKDSLMKAIRNIFKSKMACIWMMEKKFGIPMVNNSSPATADDNVMFM